MTGTEERTYWQEGDGNCLSGGCTGYDSVWTVDGTISAQAVTRPAGAVTITEAEYDALIAAMVADAEVLIPQQDADLAASQAAHEVLLVSANANLVSGTPLTQAQADAITGA